MAINTSDIRPEWLQVATRLQRLAKTTYLNKTKLLRINIIVNSDGVPIFWPEPSSTPLEIAGGNQDWINQL